MAVNFLDNVSIDGDVTIGPVASSAGLLHVSAGTSGDARVVIHADTDNSDENDVPQIWFKADGDITEGLIGLNNNYLDFVSNVNGLNGFRYFTGATNNTGTTDPYTNATEKMRLTNTGDLGIGTTSPSEKLEVVGDIKVNDSLNPNIRFARGASYWWDIGHTASDFQLESATGGVIMHLNYNGNVGIGTTSPGEKLEVNGSVKATGYKTSSGTGVTTNVTVRNSNNSGTTTFQIVGGIIVGIT